MPSMLTINLNVADMHVHAHGLDAAQMAEIKRSIVNLKGTIMATAVQHTAQLEAMATRAEKVKQEILAALAVISQGNTTPEQDAAVARIEAVLGGLDDLNVDAAPVPA